MILLNHKVHHQRSFLCHLNEFNIIFHEDENMTYIDFLCLRYLFICKVLLGMSLLTTKEKMDYLFPNQTHDYCRQICYLCTTMQMVFSCSMHYYVTDYEFHCSLDFPFQTNFLPQN